MSPKTVANAMIKSFSLCTQMHNAQAHTHTNLEIKPVTKLFKTKVISQPNLIHSQRDENDSENVTPPQKNGLFRTKVYHNKHEMYLTEQFFITVNCHNAIFIRFAAVSFLFFSICRLYFLSSYFS